MIPQYVKDKEKGYIVESGSNENGNYIKFNNGLAVCSGSFSIESNISEKLVYLPINFIDTTYSVVVAPSYAYSKKHIFSISASNNAYFVVFPTSIDTNNVPVVASYGYYIAIGKWK